MKNQEEGKVAWTCPCGQSGEAESRQALEGEICNKCGAAILARAEIVIT